MAPVTHPASSAIRHGSLDVHRADIATCYHEAGHAVAAVVLWPRQDTQTALDAPGGTTLPGGAPAVRPFDRIIVQSPFDIAAATALHHYEAAEWWGCVEGVQPEWHEIIFRLADDPDGEQLVRWQTAARNEVITEFAGPVAAFVGVHGGDRDRLVDATRRVLAGGIDHLDLALDVEHVREIVYRFDLDVLPLLHETHALVTDDRLWTAIEALAGRLAEVHEVEWEEAEAIIARFLHGCTIR